MTKPFKKPFRKRHLFPRSVDDVVKAATKPLMNQQGKLYGACLRDWAKIVGPERAAVTRPERLQFPTREQADGATLHLTAKPSAAPELAYVTEQMLEQCARYFGYRAITRIVIHSSHGAFAQHTDSSTPHTPKTPSKSAEIPADIAPEMRDVFTRLAAHVASAKDKKKP